MTLPRQVTQVCGRFLELAPDDLVEGLYLRGGLAFGEYVAGSSDIDFVAVLSHRPDAGEVEALSAVHADLAAWSPVHFDGMHVLAADLTAWCVLGAARLEHLLETGRMTAKSAAGRWGLRHYPERFHRVLREALRLRGLPGDDAPPQYDDPAERAREVAAFTARVVAAGAGYASSDIGP